MILAGSAVARETQPDPVWEEMSVADARALVAESGGVVRSVEDTDTGDYVMTIDYPDGLPVYLDGTSCRGAGEAKRCKEFQLSAYFAFDTEAEALAQEHAVDIVWLADKQIGVELLVWRMGFVGGVTRTHMLNTFLTFVETVWAAHAIVYPPSPEADVSASA